MNDGLTEESDNLAANAVFTEGSTMRHVIKMTAAGAIGLISIFFVDLLNLFYISMLGDKELTAAVGYASTVMFFTISVNVGLTIGATAIVSRGLGAGKIANARSDAGSTLVFIVVINLLSMAIIFPVLGPLLGLIGATGQALEAAHEFMQIVIVTIPLMGLGIGCSGLLRARGDARRAMYVTLSAGIIAAIIDPILIIYLELGLRGAAIATAITRVGLVATGLYGVWFIHKMIAMPSANHLLGLIKPYFFIAIPAMLAQIATPISNGFMTATMAEFGSDAVAGWAVIGRLVPFAFVALLTLSAAVGPILGQNVGAKLFDRINATMWNSLLFALVYTMTVWVVLFVSSDTIIAIFGLTDEASKLVRFFCMIIGGTYLFQGGLFVANAAFNNLGYPYLSTIFNWGRATIGTVPFAWAGAYWGPNGALAGYGIGGTFFGVGAVIVCFIIIKSLPQKLEKEQNS